MEPLRSRLGGSCGQPTGGCPSRVRTRRHVPPLLAGSDSRWRRRILFEQIGDQDHAVAVWTVASESHRTSKQASFGAAPLAEGLLATARTLPDRMRHQQPLSLKLLADERYIDSS